MNKRVRFFFSGVVQGVGFRPFIYRLAVKNGLGGFVRNRPDGVLAEVEGAAAGIASFLCEVRRLLPPMADVTDIGSEEIAIREEREFRIVQSDLRGHGDVHIAPDTAVCPDCLRELFNPADRRYRYPFINCTHCGPRLTIINGIPYDRIHTSMACFPMCPECEAEYKNPADRRFHAEPVACARCGPKLFLLGRGGECLEVDDPVRKSIELLAAGKILAIKGLGGFHLSVDAGNEAAAQRLRSLKFREEKPLAIMVRDIARVQEIAAVGPEEEALLLSPHRPILLLRKADSQQIAPGIAPGLGNLGIMLPYTPLHHLLMDGPFPALVMTSANQSDEPICIGNRESVLRLGGIADFFLVHDRDIFVRCDDSVAMVANAQPVFSRRSRGFAPKPVRLRNDYPEVMALGPQLKGTVCIVKGSFAFLSPHIGDLETPTAQDFFRETIALMKRITESDPKVIACDLHPGYYSTKIAGEFPDSEIIPIQHHHAHIVSCMAENGISGDVIGIAMDGTGYGPDGTAWGGEFMVADEAGYARKGHIKYVPLPGGGKAIREPWRIAMSLLRQVYGEAWPEIACRLDIMPDPGRSALLEKAMARKINCPSASGLGRIFDGIAVLIGLRRTVSFEGQAAMELEAAAEGSAGDPFPYEITRGSGGIRLLDFGPTVRAVAQGRMAGKDRGGLSASFHATLHRAFLEVVMQIREETKLNRIILSGGCFQNRILLEGCMKILKEARFEVFAHHYVPANDGGISLGQAVAAGAIHKLKKR